VSMQDPIADLLTRIRNAQRAGHADVCIPHSKIKVAICRVLQQEGYIDSFRATEGVIRSLWVNLKYRRGEPVIEELHRVSRPGLRVEKSHADLQRIRGGLGVAIVSTSKGVVADSVARELGIGGEVLCTVF